MTYQNQNQNSLQNKLYQHKVFNQFEECYSPLLLPKIAKYLFHIKFNSAFISFISKLKLYDSSTIKRQNKIIKQMQIKNSLSLIQKQLKLNFLKSKSKGQYSPFKQKQKSNSKNQDFDGKTIKNLEFNFKHISSLSIFQQLYEYIKVMSNRLEDLDQFTQILKQYYTIRSQFSQKLQKISNFMQKAIQTAKNYIEQIFHVQNKVVDKDQINKIKYYHLIKAGCRKFNQDNQNQCGKTQRNQNYGKFQNKNNRFNTQAESSNQIKYKFLKRKSSNNPFIKNKVSKIINLEVSKQHQNEMLTNKSQISFNLNSNKDQSLKNTQKQFFQDQQKQVDQHFFDQSNTEKSKYPLSFKSQKIFLQSKIKKRQNITTWHLIQNLQMQTQQERELQALKLRQKAQESQCIGITQKAPLSKAQNKRNSSKKSMETSNNNLKNPTSKRVSVSKISNHVSSRSSFTNESAKFNGKKIYGVKARNSNQSQQLQNRKSKDFKEFNKTRKIRFGAFKKDYSNFSDQDSKAPSIDGKKSNEKIRSRRNGKKVASQMNDKFQRIIQDKNIEKIIHSNQQRQNDVANKQNNALSKKYSSKIKRIKKGTQTSIFSSHQLLGEQYFKASFRVQRPKQLKIDRQNMTVNYSDLLQLQKNLKPINNYNESKMMTRYSFQYANHQLLNFQFRYKNGKLQFNHEFYIKNQDQHKNDEDMQQEIQRKKYSKKENNRIDFMNHFKKSLENYSQPVQKGFDDDQGLQTGRNQEEELGAGSYGDYLKKMLNSTAKHMQKSEEIEKIVF